MKLIKVAVIISLTPSLVFAELSKEAKFRVARLKKLATSAPARGFTDGIVKSASRTTTVTNSPTLDITKKKKPVMDKVRLRNGDVLSGKLIDMFDENDVKM